MNTSEFLRRIWPSTGLYVVARLTPRGFRHTVCETIEEAVAMIAQFDASGVATYHACAAYREREARACFYTVTEDERFTAVAGARGLAVSACSGHGFKFGAVLGERTAAALLGEVGFGAYARWLAGAGPITI